MLPILIKVASEATTNKWRLAAGVYGLLVILAVKGVIPIDSLKDVLGITSDRELYEWITVITVAFLGGTPAAPGWRSADKELPAGQTTDNVLIVPKSVETEKGSE